MKLKPKEKTFLLPLLLGIGAVGAAVLISRLNSVEK
jgi:hypothetical protein